MANVEFHDNSEAVKAALNGAIEAFLHEAAGELTSQTQRNTRVDTGQTKGAWQYNVAKSGTITVATIGNPLENAIWEEFGTGEYAIHGDGRKGGWKYRDHKGNWHCTKGKTPTRAFFTAYTSTKPKIIKLAEQTIGARMK